jgi:hypothetical protein
VSATIFAPTQIAGCELWLRADLGITLNGGTVSAWADQSGTGDSNKNCTQGTAANQPTYNASDAGYNGKPTLSFDGTNDFMVSAVWSVAPTTVGTVLAVCECASSGTRIIFCFASAGGSGELYANGGGATDLHYYQGADISLAGEADITAKHVYQIDRNGASTAYYQDALTALGSGNAGSGALDRVILGSNDPSAPSNPLQGKIAEVISYNRIITTAERSRVMSYLGARYGVTIGA